MPGFAGHNLANAVLGRWQMGVLGVFQSGQTFTVYDSVNQSNAFIAGAMRPNLIGDPTSGAQSLGQWFNTAAFQSAPAFTVGGSPRSLLRGPSWNTLDLTLSKNFKVTERVSTELRSEFFNVLNHPNFDIPGHTQGNPDFGVISSAEPARTVQIALRILF